MQLYVFKCQCSRRSRAEALISVTCADHAAPTEPACQLSPRPRPRPAALERVCKSPRPRLDCLQWDLASSATKMLNTRFCVLTMAVATVFCALVALLLINHRCAQRRGSPRAVVMATVDATTMMIGAAPRLQARRRHPRRRQPRRQPSRDLLPASTIAEFCKARARHSVATVLVVRQYFFAGGQDLVSDESFL